MEQPENLYDYSVSPYIFINYRRADSDHLVPRLYAELIKDFSSEQVFLDTRSIEPGEKFGDVIEGKVSKCRILIVDIGKRWLSPRNKRRLHEPDDWVRREIEIGISRNILLIPVLIDNAKIPNLNDLPDTLRDMFQSNVFPIADTCFEYSIALLRKSIQRTIPLEDRLRDAYYNDQISSEDRIRIMRLPLELREEAFDKALEKAILRREIEEDIRSEKLSEIIEALEKEVGKNIRIGCINVVNNETSIEIYIDCSILVPKSSMHSTITSKGWQQDARGIYHKIYICDRNEKYGRFQEKLVDIAGEIIEANGFTGIGVYGIYVYFPLD